MKGISKETQDFISFVFSEHLTAVENGECSTYFECDEEEWFAENLVNRVHSDAATSILTEKDVDFLEYVCDVHASQAESGYGSLWKGDPDEEADYMAKVMAEVRAAQEAAKDRWMTYDDDSGSYQVIPKISTYVNNDNLYVGFDFYDPDFGGIDHFADITVNVQRLPYLQCAINTNLNGQQIVNFLLKNDFGYFTGGSQNSGFCSFPVFEFKEERLRQIDSETFEAYAKAHEKERRPLKELLNDALEKQKSPPEKELPGKEKGRD